MFDLDALFFHLPVDTPVEDLFKEFEGPFLSRKSTTENGLKTWYDTFDWRLYNNGLRLVSDASGWNLIKLSDDSPIAHSRRQGTPRFWWDFPKNSRLRDILSKLLSVRALLEVIAVQQQSTNINVLNSDEKTVLRLKHVQMDVVGGRKTTDMSFLGLSPVRGYNHEFDVVHEFLVSRGLQKPGQNIYEIVLGHATRHPGAYSSKPGIPLSSGVVIHEAVRQICRALLAVIRTNIPGVREDLDTEFLHDFRVGIRRTRSIITQIKQVFPKAGLDHFKGLFSQLAKRTNRLRDLDVWLLNRSSYEAVLPEDLRKGIEPVFQSITRERSAEQEKLRNVLEGKELDFLDGWQTFLDEPYTSSSETRNALLPAIEVSSKYIWKQYEKVIRRGKVISDASSDEPLHRLRIDCKKLRYLLEFFSSLYDETTMKDMIRHLKRLQDNLGDFNDFSVQQDGLRRLVQGIAAGKDDSLRIAAAIGGLIVHLHQNKVRVRSAFAATFESFACSENEEKFRQLFTTVRSV